MKNPIVSIVLGTYNRLPFLKLTVESIRQECKDLLHEIIIVDGGSDDGTLQWLSEQKDIITIVQHNRGEWQGKTIERRSWGYFMNLTFKCAQGKYVCMVSDDCVLVPGAIKNGINYFDQKLGEGVKLGALAFWWREWPKEEEYHVGCTLGEKLYVNHGMYLKQALEDVNYIDEENFFFYNGDGDLCLKIWQKGYEILDAPDSYVEHYPFANVDVRKTNYKKFNADLNNYFKKWEGIFYDPVKNNCGKIIKKYFEDENQTVQKFQALHGSIIKRNPKLLREKTRAGKIKDQIKWKYQALKRKIKTFVNH